MLPPVENLSENVLTIQQPLDGFSYVLVPAKFYDEKNKAKYLDFLGLKADDCIVCSDYISEADIYNVYLKPKSENGDIQHPASVLLAKLIKENLERTDEPRVYLNIKDQCYEMMVLKGANLLFSNYFRFNTKEDFLYFLLFAMDQLHLDTETVPVYFLGMVVEDSKIVELTKRYVRDVRFKKDLTCE